MHSDSGGNMYEEEESTVFSKETIMNQLSCKRKLKYVDVICMSPQINGTRHKV